MAQLQEASRNWGRDALRRALHAARVPAGAVFNVKEALEQPGVWDRYVVEEDGLNRMRTSATNVTRWSE